MLSTSNLVLALDAVIDLQLHTSYSDGRWTAEQLLDHLVREGFALAAITDHDRPDTAVEVQHLALAARLPLLVAAEMTTTWRGGVVDVLCYGFTPHQQALTEVAQALARRQQDNTRVVYERLCRSGYLVPDGPDELRTLLDVPSAQQPHVLVALVKDRVGIDERAAGDLVWEAGCAFATTEIATVVDAAHRSEAVCLIAHPGRTDGFVCFDEALLDQLREDVPIDGLEVYYPAHTPEQTTLYAAYAEAYELLVSAGSDSHGPEKKPIKYPAKRCRKLLERLGIHLA